MGTTVQYYNQNCVKVLSQPLFLYILSSRFKIQIPKEPLPENVSCRVVIKKIVIPNIAFQTSLNRPAYILFHVLLYFVIISGCPNTPSEKTCTTQVILIFVFIFGLSLEYKTATKVTKITFTKHV